LSSFQIKAAKLTNEKDKKLYSEIKPKEKGKKAPTISEEILAATKPAQSNPQLQFLHNALSMRLQTENPFDEFREAVEKAILEKANLQS
jgi:hypothetical protein